MKKKDFIEFLKDIDQHSLIYFIDEYYKDNPKYVAKFTEEQIEEMEDLLKF